MSYINFINLKGQVIPCKKLYLIDKDNELLDVKYQHKERWWDYLFIENVNTNINENITNTSSDERENIPNIYLQFFKSNRFTFQPKAIYIIDSDGNAIEFTNEIKKSWGDFVIQFNPTFDFYEDISNNVSENLENIDVDCCVVDIIPTFNFYEDIPIIVGEDLDSSIENDLALDSIQVVLTPI
jgi:hypothetical protein